VCRCEAIGWCRKDDGPRHAALASCVCIVIVSPFVYVLTVCLGAMVTARARLVPLDISSMSALTCTLLMC
jgi:hypothetical protein